MLKKKLMILLLSRPGNTPVMIAIILNIIGNASNIIADKLLLIVSKNAKIILYNLDSYFF